MMRVKKALAVLVSLLLSSVLVCGGVSAEERADPSLRVRVNGTWFATSLADYQGQDNVWVACPVELEKFNANTTNYFSISTNVKNTADFSDTSVDIYSTAATEGIYSLLTSHRYCDDNFTWYTDRNINFRVEFYDGSKWTTVPATPCEGTDFHSVAGYFEGNDTWYNGACNLDLGSLEGMTKARISVNLHVGSNLSILDYSDNEGDVYLPVEKEESTTTAAGEGTTTTKTDDPPKTGDAGTVLPIAGLLLISGAAVLLVSRRK